MFQLDLKSNKSIYEQITDGCKEYIISGVLKAGDKLPSVRELSSILTVNPNTIQKAYGYLEAQGWIYTVAGKGCFVAEDMPQADNKAKAALYEKLDSAVRELVYIGEDEAAIIAHIGKKFKERGTDI